MMPHERCQQYSCWLQSFCTTELPEPPRFHIGQIVQVVWTDEDEIERIAIAEILGIVRSCSSWLNIPGWWYIVQISQEDGRSLSWEPPPEEAHESELRAIP